MVYFCFSCAKRPDDALWTAMMTDQANTQSTLWFIGFPFYRLCARFFLYLPISNKMRCT